MGILLKKEILIDYKTNTFIYIMPEMIGIHCYLREPGLECKETIETGTRSAVCGEFISICAISNTKPTPDSTIILQKIMEEVKYKIVRGQVVYSKN